MEAPLFVVQPLLDEGPHQIRIELVASCSPEVSELGCRASRPVDFSDSGDRPFDCGSMVEPVGVAVDGEQRVR